MYCILYAPLAADRCRDFLLPILLRNVGYAHRNQHVAKGRFTSEDQLMAWLLAGLLTHGVPGVPQNPCAPPFGSRHPLWTH
jgi:hypothetical protein